MSAVSRSHAQLSIYWLRCSLAASGCRVESLGWVQLHAPVYRQRSGLSKSLRPGGAPKRKLVFVLYAQLAQYSSKL